MRKRTYASSSEFENGSTPESALRCCTYKKFGKSGLGLECAEKMTYHDWHIFHFSNFATGPRTHIAQVVSLAQAFALLPLPIAHLTAEDGSVGAGPFPAFAHLNGGQQDEQGDRGEHCRYGRSVSGRCLARECLCQRRIGWLI